MHVLGLTNMRVSELASPFEAMGDDGTLVTVDPDGGMGAYASALRRGGRCVERQQSDAILVYNGVGLLGVVGILLSFRYDCPLLVRLNGDVHRQHREKVEKFVQRRQWTALANHLVFVALTRTAFRWADGFVPVSSSLTDIVHRQTSCPRERIVAVPNPVSLDEYEPAGGRANRRPTAEDERLLTVTNLDFRGKYEAVVQLVDSLTQLLRRRPQLEYVIAGDGFYYDRLECYLDTHVDSDVRERVHAPGFVDDVARLYEQADVFVYASYIDGYPNVILEAQATGLPVVTNAAYGIAEQIVDGESGVFADPDEGDRLEEVVATLLDDPGERERLGRNARQRVEAHNAPSVVGSELKAAIEEIVDALPDG